MSFAHSSTSTSNYSLSNDWLPVLIGALGGGVIAAAGTYFLTSSTSASTQPTTLGADPATNPYETEAQVNEYLLMHFASASLLQPFAKVRDAPTSAAAFPVVCARECVAILTQSAVGSNARCLDIGCAVGRSTFELARYARAVVGADYSHAFIDTANALKRSRRRNFRVKVEGDIFTSETAVVDADIDVARVSFLQADACRLDKTALGTFDLVLGANLICRLPKPRAFLADLADIVNVGGFVVLFSPHTWLEQYTPKAEWIGGYIDADGKPIRTATALVAIMKQHGFDLINEKDVPFIIRETERKNQWTVSHMTAFTRRR